MLAPFFRRRRAWRGTLLCEGATWPRKLGWRYRAITFGHVVLCVDDIDEATMDHELAHVRQYERWGILLWPAYALASLRAKLRGGDAYRDNRFEVQARGANPSGDEDSLPFGDEASPVDRPPGRARGRRL